MIRLRKEGQIIYAKVQHPQHENMTLTLWFASEEEFKKWEEYLAKWSDNLQNAQDYFKGKVGP